MTFSAFTSDITANPHILDQLTAEAQNVSPVGQCQIMEHGGVTTVMAVGA